MPSTCTRLKEWHLVMNCRKSVQAIKIPADFYIQQYIKYTSGKASGITAQMRRV